ncbi:hypothetical protein [Arthrobacter sp. STN4]|uniref:hypothetical protein n=1 Tax=Arthrobacter sp. STN4 TaxID=2923276 RepID=UPI00211A3CC9|nr:hypothetical protein [Arthrobacter sp. STN4]MCQ9162955.1 hypothetical protein [Arthrobacter sp. STN4]
MHSLDQEVESSTRLQFTIEGLCAAGFKGFVPFGALQGHADETWGRPGVYVVIREWPTDVQLMEFNPTFEYKDHSPMLPLEELQAAWDLPTPVLYIGKAGELNRGVSLKDRLSLYRRYGAGTADNHAGGRAIWQVPNADKDLLVCWMATPNVYPVCIEEQLLRQFIAEFGMLPMANRRNESPCKHLTPCHWEPAGLSDADHCPNPPPAAPTVSTWPL